MIKSNPFSNSDKFDKKKFFGRENESEKIISLLKSGKNINLTARKGIGKTTLIHGIYNELSEEKEYKLIYLNVNDIVDIEEFLNKFINVIFKKQKSKISKTKLKLSSILAEVNFTFDQNILTNQNNILINFDNVTNYDEILSSLFEYLNNLAKKVLITFDNFDQFANYSNKYLNKILLNTSNIQFVFSSRLNNKSSKITNSKNIILEEATLILLNEFEINKYHNYIIEKFNNCGIKINSKSAYYILNWSNVHTNTVNFICTKLFELNVKKIDTELIKKTLLNILDEKKVHFLQYQKLLSVYQWRLITAIAQEGKVKQITSGKFINTYNLNAASSVKTAVNSLLDKEIIFRKDNNYQIEDVFFEKWLIKK